MPRTPKQMQALTIEPPPPQMEPMIRITLRTDVGYEYHLTLTASAVQDLIDPEVGDAFIDVPVPADVRSAKKRYLHTSRVAEIDLHDELPAEQTDPALKTVKIGKSG